MATENRKDEGSIGGMHPPLPVLILGFGHNGDCIPLRSNYLKFYEAVTGGRGSGDQARGAASSYAAMVVMKQVRRDALHIAL